MTDAGVSLDLIVIDMALGLAMTLTALRSRSRG